MSVATGTLCRLIPLGDATKYRVEHGDVGEMLGVVVRVLSLGDDRWEAWYLASIDSTRISLGRFTSPEAAALRLAAERFVTVEESVR